MGGEASLAERITQIHPYGKTVVDNEDDRLHRLPRGCASEASASVIWSNDKTRSAAPRSMASLGMPKTIEDASSCAKVKAPVRRSAKSPSAPSLPIPVNRHAVVCGPSSCATDSKSTSTEGRHE